MPKRAGKASTWDQLLDFALGLPDAWEDHPWGEVVVKVRKKIFVFLGMPEGEDPGISVKLTESHEHALSTPGAAPTGYGLGKAGWVSVKIGSLDPGLLMDWVEESYRNVAPKTLVSQLDQVDTA
jgi:predicted DNA-binding protein (MmcQ/YjbR family)